MLDHIEKAVLVALRPIIAQAVQEALASHIREKAKRQSRVLAAVETVTASPDPRELVHPAVKQRGHYHYGKLTDFLRDNTVRVGLSGHEVFLKKQEQKNRAGDRMTNLVGPVILGYLLKTSINNPRLTDVHQYVQVYVTQHYPKFPKKLRVTHSTVSRVCARMIKAGLLAPRSEHLSMVINQAKVYQILNQCDPNWGVDHNTTMDTLEEVK